MLCAPSLAGESFGMVLTEAFAAGTPVIASAIAGYSDVVTDGADGVLVPPADPQRLAEELQRIYLEPARREAMGRAARETAARYAWPRVAEQVEEVYERGPGRRRSPPRPRRASPGAPGWRRSTAGRAARPSGFRRSTRRPPRRWPGTASPGASGSASPGVLGVGLTALAAHRIGLQNVVASIVRSDVGWVLIATALMMGSMMLRAVSWFAIARAALPRSPLRRRDVTSATMIGVLMSATLPARLGEPARAMVLARRTGRMRETFPVLLGTLVSQTALNILALALLGVIIVASTDLFHSSSTQLFVFSLAPLVVLVAVILAPVLVRQRNGGGRLARVVRRGPRGAASRAHRPSGLPRPAARARSPPRAQLGAWGIQLLACAALFQALGLHGQLGIGAAAAVLFAVNVTAVVPGDPVQHRRLPARRDQRARPPASGSAPPTRSPTA